MKSYAEQRAVLLRAADLIRRLDLMLDGNLVLDGLAAGDIATDLVELAADLASIEVAHKVSDVFSRRVGDVFPETRVDDVFPETLIDLTSYRQRRL